VTWFCVVSLLTALAFVGVFGARPLRAAPQSPLKMNVDLIDAKEKAFVNYQQDFLDFSKALVGNSDERAVVDGFGAVAERVNDYLDAARALLLVYNDIQCDSDRIAVTPVISEQLSHYAKLMDSETQELNGYLTFTRTLGTAATANQMREDVRSAKTALVNVAATLNGNR
jgi:hypothetical protein